LADVSRGITRGHLQLPYEVVYLGRDARRRTAGTGIGKQGDLPLPIGAFDRAWARALRNLHKAVERHPADLCRRNYHALQSFDVGTEVVDRSDAHLVLLGSLIESGRLLPGYERVQRLRNIADPHAQIGRRVAVDFEPHLRLAGDESRVDVHRVGDRLHFLDELFGILLELLQVRPGNHELHVSVAETAARKRLNDLHAGPQVGIFL
jgi:hypothetical protein